ncbi:MAG: putative fatty-acid--CoA ligase [Ilumatobacteraceae bacterium]|nr:putative fatty-acid--CoA ligase [Ilumatobacteraceae bacterium]
MPRSTLARLRRLIDVPRVMASIALDVTRVSWRARNGRMPDFLTLYAQVQPDKPAVIDDRPDGTVTSLTYAELNARTNRLAHVLQDLGVRAGETKVIWCGQNSIGVVTMINAARKLGLTAVPLNYRLSDEEAAYVTDHCDADIVYVDAEFAATFERIRGDIPQVSTVLVFGGPAPAGMLSADELMASASDAEPDIAEATEAGATMIYTSGTTGKPKGAFRRGNSGTAQVGALIAHIGYTTDDVYLPTGPLYHSGPGGFLGVAQALGQTTVLQRKFNAEDWLRLVTKYGVTSTFSAPTPIRMVCALPADVKAKYDTSSMKRMIANAAPWSFALKQMYLADFPADSLFEVYGSTELGVNCVLLPKDQLRKPGSCGQPSPLVEIKLFDDDGNEVAGTGPDHPGELYVKSPSVFADYYKQHDKFEADQKHGYQTVGDIAYLDDEGFVYICDRKKDMIISGGMNIYPAEIEAALEAHVDIYEAAVFGIPSDEWGETVHAVVVQREGAGLTDADVTVHAREKLASYKVPRSITWSDELPKTGSGKILKRELRAPFWAGRDSKV